MERFVIDTLVVVAVLCVAVPMGYRLIFKARKEVEEIQAENTRPTTTQTPK